MALNRGPHDIGQKIPSFEFFLTCKFVFFFVFFGRQRKFGKNPFDLR